ncbi:MAG: DUF1501 domain-containing protein [Planctomycetes bacterium]|nr:DUF1501 domain-containing protein [Planctomycetota bacterium]
MASPFAVNLPRVADLRGGVGSLSRRDVLKRAAALGVSFLLPGLEGRAADSRGPERPKSLIALWMGGGPSQLETFDPHPGTAIGGEIQGIDTKIPGVQISHLLPHLAEQIHEMCLIRSMVSKEGDHERGTYLIKTGYRPDPTLIHPSLGAIVAHETPADRLEIPQYISILDTQWPGRGGYFGDDYDAFKVLDPNRNLQNMKAPVETDRQSRRLRDLDVVERTFRRRRAFQADATLHQDTVRRALTMMTSEQLQAFQVENEPAAIREAYGNTPFGAGCLIARRLVEVGVRSIEVNLNGFDTHANNFEGQSTQARIFDPAFATLIQDLKDRDLLDSTVVLWMGEFGRTPAINKVGGRDHWPTGFSCVVGGGGFQKGLVIGETDPEGKKAEPEDPIEISHLFATIMRTLGVEYGKEIVTPVGRPMLLCQGKPIERLLA